MCILCLPFGKKGKAEIGEHEFATGFSGMHLDFSGANDSLFSDAYFEAPNEKATSVRH